MTVKFHKYYVTDGVTKARVYYSPNIMGATGQKCITLYEKNYGSNLPKVLPGVRNDSDMTTDYFENNRRTFLEGTPEYEELLPKLRQWGIAR